MATPSQEDYLETIWQLTEEKGYARAADIAQRLGISRASVSRMIRKLNATGQLTYERYRGLNLTTEGRYKGQSLYARHQALTNFLEVMGFDKPRQVLTTVEGIEHFFGPDELLRIERFIRFLRDHPEIQDQWQQWQCEHPMPGPGSP